jgi:chromosomal replication initiator protein
MKMEESKQFNWEEILKEVSKKVPTMYYSPFIQPLTFKSVDSDIITIYAPSKTIKDHVEKKYQQHIEEAVEKIVGTKYKITISLDSSIGHPISNFVESNFQDSSNQFHPDYTFDNFINGDSNLLVIQAAKEVVQTPGIINPLYIYGKVGIGKTHLVHAIGRELDNKLSSVKYISITQFLSEFVYNLQQKNGIDSFRAKYQSYKCLIIDDIHQLNSTAEKTQDEFYLLYNFLFERNRQIIITSDRPIHELPLQDRIKSRFLSGYQVELKFPDISVREKLIFKKSNELSLNLSPFAIQYIIENFKSDIRSILGSLNELSLYKRTFNLLILSDDKIREILESRIEKIGKTDIQYDKVIDSVCEYYSQEKLNVLSKSRRSEYIVPRHVSMYLLHEICNMNKSAIGKLFNTNHTTVISALKKVEKSIKNDDNFRRVVSGFKKKFEFQ